MISQIVRKNYAINIYDIYYMGSTKKKEKKWLPHKTWVFKSLHNAIMSHY